jgi:hypothetical protein
MVEKTGLEIIGLITVVIVGIGAAVINAVGDGEEVGDDFFLL